MLFECSIFANFSSHRSHRISDSYILNLVKSLEALNISNLILSQRVLINIIMSVVEETPFRQIRAKFNSDTVTVYQAYSPQIADAAIVAQKFVPPFKFSRMTWIKPSFLWMAYRSGWATKPGQERILAIEITRDGFEWALRNSSLSCDNNKAAPVRVQWDPERDLFLNRLNYRSIQIGLGGEAVHRYVNEWIVSMKDVTAIMRQCGENVQSANCDTQNVYHSFLLKLLTLCHKK